MLILQTTPELISAIELVSIILSVVALIVTVIGFFASLKFYRDAVALQGKANEALTKLEERTQFIQTQVGGMFDKTLEAAIGKREMLSENFVQVIEQLEETKSKIVQESVKQIGAAGEQERNRLAEIVNTQMELVRQKVETAKESAEDLSDLSDGEIALLLRLHYAKTHLKPWELGDGTPDMSMRRALAFARNLTEKGLVQYSNGKYSLCPSGAVIAKNISRISIERGIRLVIDEDS